jgi:Icc protein
MPSIEAVLGRRGKACFELKAFPPFTNSRFPVHIVDMPLHLDPLSRRRFLHGSAVLALTSVTRGFAATPGGENWALLSDTHIAADAALKSRQGVNMADHLRRVVTEVLAEKDSLAGVIIDGDCAYDDGQPGDYTLLLELLNPLQSAGLPIHFTLGNHDDRDVFRTALGQAAGSSPVAAKHCSLIETPFANLILLDSLRYVNKVEGEFGAEQLAWLGKLLAAAPDKPAVVIGHHYPQVFREDIIPGDEKIKISGLVDSEPFLEVLRTHPSAKAYVYGHSHTWLTKKDADGLHEINLPPTAYVFDNARPNGWVRARLSATGISLELRALDTAHPEHGKMRELVWR